MVLPLAPPALAAVATLRFQVPGRLLAAECHAPAARELTLPLGLAQFDDPYDIQSPPLMAVVVLATLPILVLYVSFQRSFVEGLAASGANG